MSKLKVTIAGHVFQARFEEAMAPKTVAAFKAKMPFKGKIVHVRWSGEAVWIPLGELDFGVTFENNTSHPAPGHVILYPGGVSETEILVAYGPVAFASKAGQLSGNHYITITSDLDKLAELGRKTLWEGAQEISFELV